MMTSEAQKLPKGWQWVRLEELCNTTSGGTPSRKISSYYGGEIPWVKSGELEDCLIYKTEEKITQEAVNNSSAKVFSSGTLLIALYGATVGKLGILQVNAATNQAVCAIFPGEYIYRDYLYFYLLSQRNQLLELSAGGAQANISQEIIRRLEITLPPLAEQKRIAAIAQKADRLRRTRRYALQLSDTYLQSSSNTTSGLNTISTGIVKQCIVPIPPLPLQEKFARIVQKFERLRTQQREAERQAEYLFQTLLHRAFRGELTPQHANDEPASVLLEQIGAEHTQAEAEAKAATQAMGDAAEYLGTKAKQQDTEPIQLTIPGME
ncbi:MULTISPECIES: restriction endonuclease subunit S [unclassified Coleofasciculus]|uniref:restriction endonuclease subunit S n=1 Tax=unclassified Coleofasciculus TaxID=2692782 RepID=UPI00187E0F37|nr:MULTISPECIES: restriction endonuclease subunit S [unclassified Coleofasciculus]MBE9125021.1 restriction endonuclease subunit S [Coleofasciculus sp. LEGE 07081]MBE9147659.1 restriction endonuclease subunit S [Coleofasciculus sp. LEGE 07092]